MTEAIRQGDARTPITVGVIPWAQIWPNAKPVFYAPEVAKHLDFVCVHVDPGKDKLDRAIAALAVYDIGKPLVIEESFPIECTLTEMDQFVEGGKNRVDGSSTTSGTRSRSTIAARNRPARPSPVVTEYELLERVSRAYCLNLLLLYYFWRPSRNCLLAGSVYA